jgi:carboxyl-terminal processing protease
MAALTAISMVVLAFVTGYAAYPLLHPDAAPALEASPRTEGMANFWQVWDLLDRDFYGAKPDAQSLTYGAIAGMVERFGDPYTFFVEPQPRELERDQLAGKFGGIGATLEQTEAGWLLHPLPDQPAAQAGILDGDRLAGSGCHADHHDDDQRGDRCAGARRPRLPGDAAHRAHAGRWRRG